MTAEPLLVAVHGATGAQGAPVVRALLARGHRVRAIARDPRDLPPGVRPAPADLTDVDALLRAYDGVDAAVIVLPGGASDADAVRQADTVLTALRQARVPRAVFNAGGALWTTPPAIPFLQARTRIATGLSGAVSEATVIGPATFYLDNYSERWIVAHLAATGELIQAGAPDSPVAPVAMMDLATVIADLLTENRPPDRVVVHGPETYTGHEVAAALSVHLRRSVRWTTISSRDYLRGVARGLGGQYAANIGALYGGGVPVSPPDPPGPDTCHVTGPTTLTAWIPTQRWWA